MVGIVVGTGCWSDVAKSAAIRMSQMTGLRVEVITEWKEEFNHPSWLKCTILDRPEFDSEDSFLVFDADIVCVRKWDPASIFESLGRPFCVVPDVNTDTVYDECDALGIPFPDFYVNGGLTMFSREHKKVWDFVKRKHPKCGKWLEQGALNLALMRTDVEVCRLPRLFNVVTHLGDIERYHATTMRERAINIHFTSTSGPGHLQIIQEFYGLPNPPEPVGSS